jgi:hypothetical protein
MFRRTRYDQLFTSRRTFVIMVDEWWENREIMVNGERLDEYPIGTDYTVGRRTARFLGRARGSRAMVSWFSILHQRFYSVSDSL